MTAQACRTVSTRAPPAWAPRSSPRWFRSSADGLPGAARSRTEPLCGSSRGFGRSSPSNPSKTGVSSAGATGPGIATFEGAAFVLRQPAPDSGILARLDGPFQAGLNDLTATAYGFGFFYLEKRGAVVPDREEQRGVRVQAGSAVAPGHQIWTPWISGQGGQHHAGQFGQRIGSVSLGYAGLVVVMQCSTSKHENRTHSPPTARVEPRTAERTCT